MTEPFGMLAEMRKRNWAWMYEVNDEFHSLNDLESFVLETLHINNK